MTVFNDRPRLLQKYREGEPAALELVYVHYARDVKVHVAWQARRLGISFLTGNDAARELCQDVFVKAFSQNARDAFDANRAFWPYLKTITKNTVIDFVRALHNQAHAVESLAPQNRLFSEPCYLDAPLLQTLTTVRGYIDELPAPLTRLYHERFILDHSQDTAAKNLELSRNQVRRLERQLCGGLKKRLKACGMYES